MKKLMTLLLGMGFAVAASAAQINWGIAGLVKYNNTNVGNAGATFSLVYLTDASKWSAAANDLAAGKTSSVATIAKTKTTNASSVSMATVDPWLFTWAEGTASTDISSAVVKSPSVFAMLVTTVQDGKTYYWASDTYNVSNSSTDSNWSATTSTYTMNVTAANAMGTTGSNWTAAAVPEPSTAALALAGLALLLKRRKA